jgi:DNA-directed RNA polymerase specialized sigma24 family protein
MPLDAPHELPSDRNAWACLAADLGQPQELRDRAWEQLFPVIQRIGRQIASRFRGHPFDDLAAESAAIIWARIQQFQPERGDFENWCRTVLQHHAIDIWRKQERNPVQPAVGGQEKCLALQSATVDDAQAGSEAAMARCRQLRSLLNRIAWPRSRAVDYFAVLLLQLRLAAARHFTQDPLSQDRAWRSELSAHVEWLLPWSADEQQARLKSDWPPLATLWQAVSTALGQQLLEQYPDCQPTQMVTIVSGSPELVLLAAQAVDVRRCLLLYTPSENPSHDQTGRMEMVRRLLQADGRDCVPAAFANDKTLEHEIPAAIDQFTQGQSPDTLVLDLTPSTKWMTLIADRSMPAGSWRLYVKNDTLSTRDNRPEPGSERLTCWRN